MFLLDTNVLSELRKAKLGRSSPRFSAWAKAEDSEDHFISAVTLMEVEIGILGLERRDPLQAAVLRRWMIGYVLPAFATRTLPVNEAVALRCATLHVPDRRPYLDALIAATALVHGLTLVTRNVADFAPLSVPLINPWGP